MKELSATPVALGRTVTERRGGYCVLNFRSIDTLNSLSNKPSSSLKKCYIDKDIYGKSAKNKERNSDFPKKNTTTLKYENFGSVFISVK